MKLKIINLFIRVFFYKKRSLILFIVMKFFKVKENIILIHKFILKKKLIQKIDILIHFYHN